MRRCPLSTKIWFPFNPGFHTHSDEPVLRGSMQVEIRVEVRRCHLSHELEAQVMERSSRKTRVFSILPSNTNIHTILGKGLKNSPVTHKRCSKTASLRATPTMARSVAFLPTPALAKPHCRSAESRPQCPKM